MFLYPQDALDAHLRATATCDVALIASAFIEKARFVGTDDREKLLIEDLIDLMRDDPDEPWRMDHKSRFLYPLGDGKQFYEFLEFVDHEIYGPMRATGTLLHDQVRGWRITSYTLSFSVPNKVVDETNFMQLVSATDS